MIEFIMKTKNDIMEEKDIDEKLKKALKDIKDGLLFSEDDGDEELEPIMFENNKSVFENKKKQMIGVELWQKMIILE